MRDVDFGLKSFNDFFYGGWKDLVDDFNEN